MEIFHVEESGVTRELRTRAKAVNFGVIYGQGESGLAKALGIPRKEAAAFIEAYFARHSGVRDFMEATLAQARGGRSQREDSRRHAEGLASGTSKTSSSCTVSIIFVPGVGGSARASMASLTSTTRGTSSSRKRPHLGAGALSRAFLFCPTCAG